MTNKLLLAALLVSLAAPAAAAQNATGDLCHVYVVDVEKARKASEEYRDTGDPARDTKALADALNADDNAAAELTLDGADTARAKKYLKVGGRRYLVGVECRSKTEAEKDKP
jgi:hypothetical protein